jgi:hypothetical protein
MMLGLQPSRRLGANDKLSHPREARKWLAALSPDRSLEVCIEVAREISAARRTFAVPDPDRADALVMADKWVSPHRIALLRDYSAGSAADREREQRVWEALAALQQAFSAAYDGLLEALRELPRERKWRSRTPMLVTRRLAQIRHDAVLRTFRYEQWIPRRWRQLHDLYLWVREQDMHDRPVSHAVIGGGGGDNTPESEYIRILLTQLLNQGRFGPRDTLRIQRLLASWTGSLRLSRKARSLHALAVDTGSQTGLQVRSAAASAGVFWLDLTPLLKEVATELERARRERAGSNDGDTQSADERIALLEQAGALWSGRNIEVRREFHTESSLTMRVAFGIAGIERAMRRDARAARSASGSGSEMVEEIEILEVGELPGAPADSDNWLVIDRSATACRMRGVPPAVSGVAPGTLAGIRDDIAGGWSIGVVRRMRRAAGNEIELDLQLISPNPRRMTLADPVIRTQVSDETVLGMTQIAPRPGRNNALFLPPGDTLPSLPGRSVIVERKHYKLGKTYWCRIGRNSYTLMLKRALERNDDYVWAAIEVEKRK